jgi:hypothetical protein
MAGLRRVWQPSNDYLDGVKTAPSEAETYSTTSSRITGAVAILIGLACLVDIAVEWRTRGGLITAAFVGAAMVLAYITLIRPSITLSPQRLSVRNHVRSHQVPWSVVEGVDVTDILRIQLPGRQLRCPGVQLMMRDMRRQRTGRIKPDQDSSLSRAEFIVGRIEYHREYYGKTSTGEPSSRWAVAEPALLGALLLIALVAWLAG